VFRPRVIPVLLLRDGALVKTVSFRDPRYIGDPVNAVRIFDELGADELVVLDILASRKRRSIPLDVVTAIAAEANMPLTVGGGIHSVAQIRSLVAAGVEKVVIGTNAVDDPGFIEEAAGHFGSSSIVVCMDVRRSAFGRTVVCRGGRPTRHDPIEFARTVEARGAGELIVQSVDRDGTMRGYDLKMLRSVSDAVGIPVVALGGAGGLQHFREAHLEGGASAVAAGSLFVLHGRLRGVLINYPERKELTFRP